MNRMRMQGMTIIQIMALIFVLGLIATVTLNLIIDKRCEDDPTSKLCIERKAAKSK